ncbi:MAG: hypothetical protein HKN47_29570, partial [Pirellulaceae bacterium]|nr:hypothetical protein [Pirellulaceae bacterium]
MNQPNPNRPSAQSKAAGEPDTLTPTESTLVADPEEIPNGSWDRLLHKISGMGFSIAIHTIIFLLLAIITIDIRLNEVVQLVSLPRIEEEDPPVEVELDPEIEVVPPENVSLFSAAPAALSTATAAATTPVLDQSLVAKADTSDLQIDAPTMSMPDPMTLIEAKPDGEIKGEARDIVDNYQQAMDRLAQELLWMLDEGPVLAVWCFD